MPGQTGTKEEAGPKKYQLATKMSSLAHSAKGVFVSLCEHMPFESKVNRNIYFSTLERAVIPYPSLFFCFLRETVELSY